LAKYYKIFLTVFITISGCSKNVVFEYQPNPGVKVNVVVMNTERHEVNGESWISLNFDYTITNSSSAPVIFRFDKIVVKYNNVLSSNVAYQSFASVIALNDSIVGERNYELYAVFPVSVGEGALKQFEIVNYGFVQ